MDDDDTSQRMTGSAWSASISSTSLRACGPGATRSLGRRCANRPSSTIPLTSVDDLPVGYTDEQDGGSYRLKRRRDAALFGYNVGPHSWKKFLHPPIIRLWQAERTDSSFQIISERQQPEKLALLGVRSCELHAIAIQDRVFMHCSLPGPDLRNQA